MVKCVSDEDMMKFLALALAELDYHMVLIDLDESCTRRMYNENLTFLQTKEP